MLSDSVEENAMADFRDVEIDFQKVYENLKASGEAATVPEAVEVLRVCGLVLQENGWWRCRAFSLRYLDAGELRESRRVA